MLAFGRASLRLITHCNLVVSRPFVLRGLSSARNFKYNEHGGSNKKFDQHDYKFSSAEANDVESTHNVERINKLISSRQKARRRGQYDEADDIRDTLFKDYGVVVDDREKVWSTTDTTQDRTQGQHDYQQHHDFQLAPDAGPIQSSLGEREILNLIAKRLKCKLNRNFQDADVLLQKLHDANVSVHDKRQEWRADGVFFDYGNKQGYTQSSFSKDTSSKDDIEQLVAQRSVARRQKHFTKADQIVEKLKKRFNVEVRDEIQSWSVGGDFGMTPQGVGGTYNQSRSSKTTEHAVEIQKLVDRRNACRNERDFGGADQLRDRLMEEYGVVIDDRVSQWIVVRKLKTRNGAKYVEFKRRGRGELSAEDEAAIVRLVQKRILAKQEKDYAKADTMRETLMRDFQVRVDDDKRVWMLDTDQYVVAKKSASIDPDIQVYIEQRVSERAAAKLKKDYELADSILKDLETKYRVQIADKTREWWVSPSSKSGVAE